MYNDRQCPMTHLTGFADAMHTIDGNADIRMDVLRRLAEQAMTDPEFRAIARDDLMMALRAYGYDLSDEELALVTRFRATLADAGVDLDLAAELGLDRARGLFGF